MLVGCWKINLVFFRSSKIFIYYSATGYSVSGKIIGRISSQISIRYNPINDKKLPRLDVSSEEVVSKKLSEKKAPPSSKPSILDTENGQILIF